MENIETTTGPVALDGRTITLAARTRVVRLGGRHGAALHVRSRPVHVEVLDEHGNREVVRIRDVHGVIVKAIGAATIAYVVAARAARRTRRRAT